MSIVNITFIYYHTERVPRFVKYYFTQKKQSEQVEMEEKEIGNKRKIS